MFSVAYEKSVLIVWDIQYHWIKPRDLFQKQMEEMLASDSAGKKRKEDESELSYGSRPRKQCFTRYTVVLSCYFSKF